MKDILQVEIMRSHKLFEINYGKLKKIAVVLLNWSCLPLSACYETPKDSSIVSVKLVFKYIF